MTNKLEIMYPLKKDLLTENEKDNPIIFNHFAYFNKQIVIDKSRNIYRVRSQSYFPTFINIDYTHINDEWYTFFYNSDLNNCKYVFQKAVKDCIASMNNVYLSRQFNREQLHSQDLPECVGLIKDLFQ